MIIKKKITRKESLEQNEIGDKVAEQSETKEKSVEEIDLFNLDNIDFKQRQERRTGERRRGFRRLDDRNLISRAREEAVAIRESAAKEGYKSGIESAKNDIAEVRKAISSFLNAKQEVFDKISPNILEIAVDIAKKIIKREIEQNPEVLTENVQEILKTYSKGEGSINIKVNPSQVDLLKQEIPNILNTIGSDAIVKVVAEETVMEGGCIVTTQNGVIDATIETQLSIISEAMKEV